MQAIILAAGMGTRLRPLTQKYPKCMLDIGGKPILQHHLEMLIKNDIKDIIIVTGYQDEIIKEKFSNMKGIRFVFNPFYETTNVLTSFWMAQDKLTDDFIYIHGDTFFEEAVLRDLINSPDKTVLAIDKKLCGEEEMKVVIQEDEIREISKQILPERAEGEFIGAAKIAVDALAFIKDESERLMRNKMFNLFFESIFQTAIEKCQYKLKYIDVSGRIWSEIDFIEDYEYIMRKWQEKSLMEFE